ncbi:MAG: DNA-processing protein DprA [Defluviitaleaceae bacterium]|nr:DNA-processing protein DprA [Defluviitaleaceae bacterium]
MRDEIYMLWLSTLVPQLGSRKLNLLLSRFDTAREIFTAHPTHVKTLGNLTDNALNNLTKNRNLDFIEILLKEMESKEMAFLSRNHDRFPTLLGSIPDPPVGIFYIGELPADATNKIAIIGSRKCSDYGLQAARLLAMPLAENGIVIVSGLARGVDSMAHKGAVDVGGKTIAVLGCGADICYPAENRQLRDKIVENGCVLSEYPPGTKPIAAFFPARNRIISGLCRGIIVAEASKKSGTLITVDQAAEQGRDVLAVPGNINSPLSAGTNHLIREGAIPVTDYTDVLFTLGLSAKVDTSEPDNQYAHGGITLNKIQEEAINSLAPEEKLLYDSLTFDPVSFDSMVMSTNLPSMNLHFLLTTLELKGLIKKLPGARYARTT